MKIITCKILFLFAFCTLNAQNMAEVHNIIDTLASPFMHGRGYVQNGIEKAAAFIENEFIKDGLLPVFDGFRQPFYISVNTFPKRMEFSADSKNFVPGIDFIIDPSSKGIDGTFSAETIRNTELLNTDSLNKKLKKAKNNFLVIDNRNKDIIDKKILELNNQVINILKYDQKIKIAGLIEITDEKISWNVSEEVTSKTIIKLNDKSVTTLDTINLSIDNEYKENYLVNNIAGYVKGTVSPDTFIVFTAHYDHIGRMGENCLFPGANDNASGIAMILSLIDHFKHNPHAYSVLFIAFASEELGLLGSSYFTTNPPFNLNKIKFLINFDLAGTGEEGITVVNGSIYKENFYDLKRINFEYNFLPEIKIRGEACISDHCFFYKSGVPCFYIYTLGGSPAYHDPYDIPENLSLAGFEGYFKLIVKFTEGL